MRRVGIVSFAQTVHVPRRDDASPPELVYPVVKEAVAASGFERHEIDFTTAGSADVLEGRPFSFGFTLDVAGAVPPIEESHVEGDGAWAAFDAWIRIQAGAADSALVIAWGKSSEGSLARVMNATLDPVYESPLGIDAVALAALQARVCGVPDADMAAVAATARAAARNNPSVGWIPDDDIGSSPATVEPLRRAFVPPVTDGACALVMAAEDVVRTPAAWIAGAAHATDAASVGARALDDPVSARAAFERARDLAGFDAVDVAELHACFAHHLPLLQRAFALGDVPVNPSGGPLVANPIMAAGLIRLGEASLQVLGAAGARQVEGARRALAHATAGQCLQSNLVWLLER